jgi:hypothetical protein
MEIGPSSLPSQPGSPQMCPSLFICTTFASSRRLLNRNGLKTDMANIECVNSSNRPWQRNTSRYRSHQVHIVITVFMEQRKQNSLVNFDASLRTISREGKNAKLIGRTQRMDSAAPKSIFFVRLRLLCGLLSLCISCLTFWAFSLRIFGVKEYPYFFYRAFFIKG